MIRVKLNDQIFVDVNTDDPQTAAKAARTYFAREHPEEFKAWQEARPISGFGQTAREGFWWALGAPFGAAGVIADAVGAPGGQTLRGIHRAIEVDSDESTRGLRPSDLISQPVPALKSLAGTALGSMSGLIAAGLGAAAAIRGGLGLAGVPVALGPLLKGTLLAGSASTSTVSLDDLLRAEGVEPQRAAALAAGLGPLIGIAEAGPLIKALNRALGRNISERTAAEIARQSLPRIGLRTAGEEALFEAGGEAARQGVAAAETGNLNLAERSGQVLLDAIGGAIGGGAFGVPAGAMERRAARQEVARAAAPAPAAPAAPPPPEPTPWLPEPPTPFTTRAEAEAYINANRAARPGVAMPNDEALLAHVNTLRANAYEEEVRALRLDAIRRAMGDLPEVTLRGNAAEDAPVGQQIEARLASGLSVEGGRAGMTPEQRTIEERAEILLPTLLEAGAADKLDLQAIEPARVAELVLDYIDANNPTNEEIAVVDRALHTLKRAGYLTTGREPGTYTIAQRSTGRASQTFQPLEQPTTDDQRAAQAMLDLIRGYKEVAQTDPARPDSQGTAPYTPDEIRERTRLIDRASPALQEQIERYLTETDPAVRSALVDTFQGYAQPAFIASSPTATTDSSTTDKMRGLPISESNLEADEQPRVGVSNRAGTKGPNLDDPGVMEQLRRQAAVEKTKGADAFKAYLKTDEGQALLRQIVANVPGMVSKTKLRNLFKERAGITLNPEIGQAAYTAAYENGIFNKLGMVAKLPTQKPKKVAKKPERLRGFVTADGTIYELKKKNQTSRDGAPDKRTVYLTADQAKALKPPAKGTWRLIVRDNGTLALATAKGGKFRITFKQNNIKPQAAPDVGLIPLELDKATRFKGGTAYENASFGSPITDTVNFAAVPTTNEQVSRAEINEAVSTFYRTVGSSGRLELAQRLLIEDLDSAVAEAAAAEGITGEISGYAQGDLAVLSLAKSNMPIAQVAIHEGWHVAENIGLLSSQDIDLLNSNLDVIRAALKASKEVQSYGIDVDALSPQEVRAYGVNARVAYGTDFGWLNQIFDKVKAFIGRIGNFLKGRGFTDWRDVYDSFIGGERASHQAAEHVGFPINFSGLMQDAIKRHRSVTETPEFKAWFGNSKVVDENTGKPKIVYHGTGASQSIEIFNTKSHGQLGAHFGTLQAASQFVWPGSSWESDPRPFVIYPVYLKIENPLRLEDKGHWAHWVVVPQLEKMVADGLLDDPQGLIPKAKAEMGKISDARADLSEPILQKLIQDLGFDGIVYENFVEDVGNDSYIVFEPEQIKSAVGNSTFNPRDQRIQFAAPKLPTDTDAAHAVVKNASRDLIKGPLKWFGSPVLTMGKVHAALRPAGDVQKMIYTRSHEFIKETEDPLAPVARLSSQERIALTKEWARASREGTPPDLSNLSKAAQDAYREAQAGVQRAFDYAIESLVIEHFRSANKTPQQRAKLDKLWAKHAGKHLWEIPKSELRVASPEGVQAMDELEKLRNKYYLPMIASGTHFVAAYKKGPDGKKTGAPIRLYSYTPNSLIQKMQGQGDPAAKLIARLKKEFPNAYVMEQGVRFSKDNDEADGLRKQGDFIAQYLSELQEVSSVRSSKEAQEVIGRMARQIDKVNISRVFKPNQNILWAVTDDNADTYLLEQLPQYLQGLSKVQARWFTEGPWTRAIDGLSPKDINFLNDLRDYSTTPTEAFGGLRSAMFFTYLGGALDTAFINSLQILQTTIPMMARDGGNASLKHVWSATKDVSKYMLSAFHPDQRFVEKLRTLGNTPDEKAAMAAAAKRGTFNPVFTHESRGQFTSAHFAKLGFSNPAKWARNANKLALLFGMPMQAVESANRAITFLAAYRAAKEAPEMILRNNRLSNRQLAPDQFYEYAVYMVDDTQTLTTKEDRAYIQRFVPAAEVATQFLSFPLKMFEIWVKNGSDMLRGIYKGGTTGDWFMAKAGAVGFWSMTGSIMAFAGLWGLPGVDFLKELLERLTEFWTGSGTQNFDADMRRLLGGGTAATALLRGIPHAANLASLNKRLAIDPLPFNDLMSMSIATLAGPAGSYAESVLRNMPTYFANGDYFNGVAAFMPRALGNVVRAMGVAANEEMYTLRGNRVISPRMVAEAQTNHLVPVWLKMAVGFQPPSFVNSRELLVRAEEIDRQMRAPTERFNKDIARLMVRMMEANRDGDIDRAAKAQEAIRQRIREVVERNAREKDPTRWININMNAIQRRAYNDFLGRGSIESLIREGRPAARRRIQEEAELYR